MFVINGDFLNFVLLDMTAAFDTVVHVILLSCLKYWVGISRKKKKKFRSYPTDTTFSGRR